MPQYCKLLRKNNKYETQIEFKTNNILDQSFCIKKNPCFRWQVL